MYMATTYFVMPIKDEAGNRGGWGVHKKHGSGTRLMSDHKNKKPAYRRAKRMANKGDKIRVSRSNGTVQRWVTVR